MKNNNLRFKPLIIVMRLVLCGLISCSLQKTVSGFAFYQAVRFERQDKTEQAIRAFEKANALSFQRNPSVLYEGGKVLLEAPFNKAQNLKKAESYFSKMTFLSPYFGKAWLYLAWAKWKKVKQDGRELTRMEQKEISSYLEKAHQFEPGNSWLNFMAAKILLSQEAVTKKQELWASQLLRNAVKPPSSNQPSPYLESSLDLLWEKYKQTRYLKDLTPKEAFSYGVLSRFFEQNHLWKERAEIEGSAASLRSMNYQEHCIRGEKLLQEGFSQRAYDEFQTAYWLNNTHPWARAGMIASKDWPNHLPETKNEQLKKILEDEESNQGSILFYLEKSVRQTADPYLKGLFASRVKDYSSAVDELQQVDLSRYPYAKRHLAKAYWELNLKRKARSVLNASVQEKSPDLRELYILKDWGIPNEEDVDAKIEMVFTRKVSQDQWFLENSRSSILNQKENRGAYLNLKPGNCVLRVMMKSAPDFSGNNAYVRFRLWNGSAYRSVGEFYINQEDWGAYQLLISTSGGWRFLQAELVNGATATSRAKGPVLELGAIDVSEKG